MSLTLAMFLVAIAANGQARTPMTKGKMAAKIAKGTFDVKITPLPVEANVGDPAIGRLSMVKQFEGEMKGTSKGQMLGIGTEVEGSGGYVAAERFIGTLGGRKGAFSLQHTGTMQGGKFEMNVAIVPDSGTDGLAGISGKMKIILEKGKHFYELEYSLAKPNAKNSTK